MKGLLRRCGMACLVLAGTAGLLHGCATATHPPVERQPSPPTPMAPVPEEPAVRAWVGLGPQGAVARAIVSASGESCPELVVDGASGPMTVRPAPPSCFEVKVCEAPIPEGALAASIGDVTLPLPPKEIRRIAILGDTGCRLKGSVCPAITGCQVDCDATTIQACNDPNEWPFAAMADLMAKTRPDLVIHVGDYHYREARCPQGNAACAGSPWGDNWPSWRADFFEPAAPLLAAAPWVFVRGNHEECSRAGHGWFYFLDPGADPATCNDDPSPYSVALTGLQLLVLNTSTADSAAASFYVPAFQTLNQLAAQGTTPSWLLSHHPLWAFLTDEDELVKLTDVLQQALGPGGLDPKIGFTVAGHIHLFEALGFAAGSAKPARPPGGVFGMSGTDLDAPITTKLVGQTIDGAQINAADTRDKFGYALAERDGAGWRFTVYSVKGEPKVVCRFEDLHLSCEDLTAGT